MNRVPVSLMEGRITFSEVDFAYPEGDLTLRDLNFEVQPGQTVAIVGQTGSGKTTLAKLVNRTYDVTPGPFQSMMLTCGIGTWPFYGARFQSSNRIFSCFPIPLPKT